MISIQYLKIRSHEERFQFTKIVAVRNYLLLELPLKSCISIQLIVERSTCLYGYDLHPQ